MFNKNLRLFEEKLGKFRIVMYVKVDNLLFLKIPYLDHSNFQDQHIFEIHLDDLQTNQ